MVSTSMSAKKYACKFFIVVVFSPFWFLAFAVRLYDILNTGFYVKRLKASEKPLECLVEMFALFLKEGVVCLVFSFCLVCARNLVLLL